jgi:hypothetical protein
MCKPTPAQGHPEVPIGASLSSLEFHYFCTFGAP